MLISWLLVIVVGCAALGVALWSAFAGAALVRNVAAILALAWVAITAIPAALRVVRRRLTGGRGL